MSVVHVRRLRQLRIPISARTPQRLLVQFVVALVLLLAISARARSEARAARCARRSSSPSRPRSSPCGSRSDRLPKAGDSLRVRPRPLRRALRLRARLQRRPRSGALRDDRRPVSRGARRLRRRAILDSCASAVRPSWPVTALLILVEGAAIPMEINRTWGQNEATPPARVFTVRRRAAGLRARRSTARRHGDHRVPVRRSGVGDSLRLLRRRRTGSRSPTATAATSRRAYKERVARLQRIARIPKRRGSRSKTLARRTSCVHRNAFANAADADTVESWLKAHGATETRALP